MLFVDAFRGELRSGFRWEQCEPAPAFEFTSHVLAPAAILYLSESLYGRIPPARMLLIGGSDWGLGVGLSRSASDHLENALAFYSSRCAQEAAAGRTVSEPGAGSLQAR